jgi:GH15 family glucan-1,4-alpha-glucosidase
MPRDLPVSNGKLLVNFDLDYRIRDIYFPWIGQENHTRGQEFRFGVWADGRFSWIGPEWENDLRYRDDTLVTDVLLTNKQLGLTIRCQDAVDFQLDVYVRRMEVRDTTGTPRDVRLFFCHDFHLYGHEVGDTAFFDPRSGSIIHYKQSRYFLANCRAAGSDLADYFSCGFRDATGIQSSWKDAEDGELASSPNAWGFAESTMGVKLALSPGGSHQADYWIAAGTHYSEVTNLNTLVAEHTPSVLVERTASYWRAWSRRDGRPLADLPRIITDLYQRSLLILRSQIDNRGAIVAANDSDIIRFGGDTYSYVWGRDGAFVAAALEKAGYPELCQRFFAFCNDALSDAGYLFQHYNPDGTLASNWHGWVLGGREVLPIQEDSTALVLWALWIHYSCSKDIDFIRPLYEKLVIKGGDFLAGYRDVETGLPIASYDLWEERYGVHAYTVATVIAGLRAAASFAEVFGDRVRVDAYRAAADSMVDGLAAHLYHPGLERYARSGYRGESGYALDEVVDISLLGLATLNAVDPGDQRMVRTADAVREHLLCQTAVGGIARYSNDVYQRDGDVPMDVPGNPWFISTLWLGEYEIARARTLDELRGALPYLEWCATNALPSGVMAEQVHPVTGVPLSVSPLTWSHSAFVWVVLAYVEKFDAMMQSG